MFENNFLPIKQTRYSNLPTSSLPSQKIVRVSYRTPDSSPFMRNSSSNVNAQRIQISLNSSQDINLRPNPSLSSIINERQPPSSGIQLYSQKKKLPGNRVLAENIFKLQEPPSFPQKIVVHETRSLKESVNNASVTSFHTRESLFQPREDDNVYALKKEIWELKKELRAEKEQNQKLLQLGKDDLICFEEVEVKKVYGKHKPINMTAQQAEEIFKKNEVLLSQLAIKDVEIRSKD